MFLEAKPVMSIFINFLNHHPKIKQWLWFILLWIGGFLAVAMITYPIKFLVGFL